MRRIGPELKMPDLKGRKPPEFLADVYYDLRDRRLLPLLALVVVAIAAVPFLLGEDAEQPVVPAPRQEADVPAGEAGTSSTLAVVESTPGLRNYKKRLKNRTPSDPFVQQYIDLPPGTELEVTETSTPVGGGGEESVAIEVDDEGGAPEGSPSSPAPGSGSGRPKSPDDPRLRFFSYRPDVRFGVAGSNDLTTYKSLDLGQLLPKENPVVVFIGVSEDGKRVAFDVSPEVATVRGPGRCIGGPQNCGLLILKEGEAADLLTGRPNRDFRLAINRIRFVEVDRPQPEKAGSSKTSVPGNLGLSQSFSK
jgi:hypothetical protein